MNKIFDPIGRLTIFFLIFERVATFELKCFDSDFPVNGVYHVCNATEFASSLTACCYNGDLNYHYCCSMSEFKSTTRGKRIGGAVGASAIILFLIFLLCFFSNRCPLRRAINHRGSTDAARADVERS